MKYFIADNHFYHANILNMDNRDFENISDMSEYMIERWNRKVKSDDEVYVLGDFSWEKGPKTWDILVRLHGKIRLVEGNHDYYYLDDSSFDDSVFESINCYDEFKENKRRCIMSHYPMPFYNHQFNSETYMLYGHVHNTYDEYMLNRFINDASRLNRDVASGEVKTTPFHMINVFCAFSDYEPLSLDEWIIVDDKRRKMINEFESKCGGLIDPQNWYEFNIETLNILKEEIHKEEE
ncbi:MAG: metallophosphoesterase family protein [Erysipelotrichaceae bacterium]|nr:metallophosphoesterase family protein [Erysipelotrichaceae bacterium]